MIGPDDRGMNMDIKKHGPLTQWQKACLVITILLSAGCLAGIFVKPGYIPINMDAVSVAIIGLAELWCPLVFYRFGLLATSSLSASVLSLMNIGAVILIIQDPEYPKLLSLVFLAIAIFYFFYSLKTWQIYEVYWLDRKKITPSASQG
jgi:membrane-bound ClpP family serine protease